MKLSTVIVDDEFPAVQLLSGYCKHIDNIELKKTFTNAAQAVDYLKENALDLLLLDIQMPGLTGIEILNRLPVPPLCIFITANPAYALEAYELDVTDYLVKPVSFERFKKAVEKAQAYHAYKQDKTEAIAARHYLMIKADYKIIKVDVDDINWIEGSGEYVKIVTEEKSWLVLDSLTNYIDNILPKNFLRIHKSYIMHLDKISQFTASSVILKNQKEFTIGRSYKDAVMKILKATYK